MGPLEDKAGFDEEDLLVNGPEEACVLIFLVSELLRVSSCGSARPSLRGGGLVEALLLSLSLRSGCDFKTECSDKWASP